MDRINGHCETVAAALSNHVLAELRSGTPADIALNAGEWDLSMVMNLCGCDSDAVN